MIGASYKAIPNSGLIVTSTQTASLCEMTLADAESFASSASICFTGRVLTNGLDDSRPPLLPLLSTLSVCFYPLQYNQETLQLFALLAFLFTMIWVFW
ncbi:hypothetical protein TELCIR_08513 [Teladorsagia circumcincta]|uniref:Uncharacterized protein n=1 Tax=Teladorsagia circumcincta TaxID=45464 RepID=A0A2G9UHK0_TELCI|nr:hypothetical protein TELCIR_08513 [Teladorsagia circumcincta]